MIRQLAAKWPKATQIMISAGIAASSDATVQIITGTRRIIFIVAARFQHFCPLSQRFLTPEVQRSTWGILSLKHSSKILFQSRLLTLLGPFDFSQFTFSSPVLWILAGCWRSTASACVPCQLCLLINSSSIPFCSPLSSRSPRTARPFKRTQSTCGIAKLKRNCKFQSWLSWSPLLLQTCQSWCQRLGAGGSPLNWSFFRTCQFYIDSQRSCAPVIAGIFTYPLKLILRKKKRLPKISIFSV